MSEFVRNPREIKQVLNPTPQLEQNPTKEREGHAETTWKLTWKPGLLGESLSGGVIRCHLSPRNCTMKPGQHGFCGVRANRDGRLVTMNYGKSVHITEETIETEAVNHYAPGSRILSLGNIGCMLNCAYCHNWKTSQAKYVDDRDVYHYTPEGIVETAIRHGIRILSWTYNDPVVWHEFVKDTATLARKAGLINLYKSAFFITPEAIEELLPCIDIFSISIKSIDPSYYKKYTGGWLEPVLDGVKQVYAAGKHVEVSTLMLTDISDDALTARKVSEWVLRELDSTVPVHFVRFHPDYRMRNTTRTPIPRLEQARAIAIETGLEHVYLGNVYDTPFSNSYCVNCNATLVTRYGLNAQIEALTETGCCRACGRNAHFKFPNGRERPVVTSESLPPSCDLVRSFDWHGDIRSLHVHVENDGPEEMPVYYRRRMLGNLSEPWAVRSLRSGESFRFIIAKSDHDEIGPELAMPSVMRSNLHEVFDRAHYPTVAIENASANSDVSPLPLFSGKS